MPWHARVAWAHEHGSGKRAGVEALACQGRGGGSNQGVLGASVDIAPWMGMPEVGGQAVGPMPSIPLSLACERGPPRA